MDKRDEQAVDALKLYYQQDLSQVDIAARMGLSRPTVAKLLAHGRDRGFVTITIHDPREEASELAARLEQRYGLACVRVAHGVARCMRLLLTWSVLRARACELFSSRVGHLSPRVRRTILR